MAQGYLLYFPDNKGVDQMMQVRRLVCAFVVCMLSPQGAGTLIFSSYVGSGPAYNVHPKKYQEFQAPQKII